MSHEYRTIPAPRRGLRARGVRDAGARFALAVEAEMNRMGALGWEYVRSDTLPSDERQGWLGGTATVFRTLLVFRRPLAVADAAPAPPMPSLAPLQAPRAAPPVEPPRLQPVVAESPSAAPLAAPRDDPPALPEPRPRLVAE